MAPRSASQSMSAKDGTPSAASTSWTATDVTEENWSRAPVNPSPHPPSGRRCALPAREKTNDTYHGDWPPDSRYLTLSYGPASKGDPFKTGTFQAACEIVGVYAPGWNLCAVMADREGIVD